MKTQTLTSVSVITLQFPSFGNPNAEREIEIAFDFEAGTVAWRNRVFKVNERLISVRKVYDDKGFGNSNYEYNCEVISVESTMQLMMKTVNSFKQPNQAINFLNELVGTVLVSNWEIDELDTVSYNLSAIQPETDNTRDAQQVLRNYDDILREAVSDDKVRQDIKHKWYRDETNTDWNALLKAEADTYIFNPSIYPDNYFNE